MSTIKFNYKIVTIGLLLGIFAMTSTSYACWGNRMGHQGPTPTSAKAALSAEQQSQLDNVQKKYEPELEGLQTALERKAAEYRQARAKEETTVGTLNRIEADFAELERQYGSLLDQANADARQIVGSEQGPWFGCNYDGCTHRNHSWNSHRGMMAPGQQHRHMDGYMACRW